MAEKETKVIGLDHSGCGVITEAVKEILNSFPGLTETIRFEELGETSGVAFTNDAGALVLTERRSITDHVVQTCQYPFLIVCRTAGTREAQKAATARFLDQIGKWICREPVETGGTKSVLSTYPKLIDGRKITKVTRSNIYGTAPNDNNSQDWLLPVVVDYTNEFELW